MHHTAVTSDFAASQVDLRNGPVDGRNRLYCHMLLPAKAIMCEHMSDGRNELQATHAGLDRIAGPGLFGLLAIDGRTPLLFNHCPS